MKKGMLYSIINIHYKLLNKKLMMVFFLISILLHSVFYTLSIEPISIVLIPFFVFIKLFLVNHLLTFDKSFIDKSSLVPFKISRISLFFLDRLATLFSFGTILVLIDLLLVFTYSPFSYLIAYLIIFVLINTTLFTAVLSHLARRFYFFATLSQCLLFLLGALPPLFNLIGNNIIREDPLLSIISNQLIQVDFRLLLIYIFCLTLLNCVSSFFMNYLFSVQYPFMNYQVLIKHKFKWFF